MSMRTVNSAPAFPGSLRMCHLQVKAFIADGNPSRAFFSLVQWAQQPAMFEIVAASQSGFPGLWRLQGSENPDNPIWNEKQTFAGLSHWDFLVTVIDV